MHGATNPLRPGLTSRTLVRWGVPLLRSSPFLLSAYLVPGRLPPRVREAAEREVRDLPRVPPDDDTPGDDWGPGAPRGTPLVPRGPAA